ncbi:MAG: hypothetical protein VYE77_07720 [Planctomycetota bacterium]|nr:hypothetical protein [Planctomycetota bacterium]
MKRFLTIACVSLFVCAGLQAQVSGSINRGAPTMTNTIAMGDHKMEVSYTAIRFGEGQWERILDNENAHERFNQLAERRPMGSVKTSCDVITAGKSVPAGNYTMFFTVNSRSGWILNLKPEKGDTIRWRLVLTETDKKQDCMHISLSPSAEDGVCSLGVAFGSKSVTVPVRVADSDDNDG